MDSLLNHSMLCSACHSELEVGEEVLECMVETCRKSYHHECNGRVLSDAEKATWICPECVCAAKKGGANCETPVGTPASIKNVALRKPRSAPRPPPALHSPEKVVPMKMSTDLEIQLLREQITSLTERLADALSVIERYHSALTECTQKVVAVSGRLQELEQIITSRSSPEVPSSPKALYNEVVKAGLTSCIHGQAGSQVITKDPANAEDISGCMVRKISVITPKSNTRTAASDKVEHRDDHRHHRDSTTSTSAKEFNQRGAEGSLAKKQRRPTSTRCTGGPNITTLKAVEYRKHIHLWNMVSGAEEVREYLLNLCPNVVCTVEELKPKGNYKSYKIGVPVAHYEKCLAADVWPENARVKAWLFRRQDSNQQTQTK